MRRPASAASAPGGQSGRLLAVATAVADVWQAPEAGAERITQALLNAPALLLERLDGWARVRLGDYVGWMRDADLAPPPAGAERVAVVTALRAPIYTSAGGDETQGVAYVTTTLPLRSPDGEGEGDAVRVHVALPGGDDAWLDARDLALRPAREPFPAREPETALALARSLLGTPYLWGGTSPEGVDCSGFVQLCLRAAGRSVPRDADQQYEQLGAVVARGDLRAGDLLFFALDGGIEHVGLMLDAARYIHAKGGEESRVMVNSLDPDDAEYNARLSGMYAGARRPFAPTAGRSSRASLFEPLAIVAAQAALAEPTAFEERLQSALDALGGRAALAARRFAGAPPRRALQLIGHDEDTARNGRRERSEHAEPGTATDAASVAIRGDEVFPAASLVKLCIAVEALRRVDLGQFALDERFDTRDEPRMGGGGALDYLDPQTRLTLHDLLFLMLGLSDNTASNFLLDLFGMGEVNETMGRLGLTKTAIARRFMDWAARAAHRENVTCADDVVALLTLIRGNALPGAARLRELLATQQAGAEVGDWLPQTATLLQKSGDLDGVYHHAGILTGSGGGCVYCILTAEQGDLPTTRYVVGRTVRALWDEWLA